MSGPEDAAPSPSGVRDMLASALFFSAMSLLVKLAGERIPAVEIVLVRSVVSLVLSIHFLRRAGISWRGNRPGLLLLRGLFGLLGLVCFFRAITRLDLAEVTVLHYTNPIWTTVLAALVLGEGLRRRHGLALACAVAGVLLVAQPPLLFGAGGAGEALPLDGVLTALAGAFFAAAAYVTVRKLGRTESPLVVVLYFPLVSVPVITPFALAGWVWPTPLEWLLLIGVGITTQAAQVFLTRGLHRLPAGPATTIGSSQVVFATLWGWLIFGAVPGPLVILGGFLVVAGVLVARSGSARG
ncbi:MAG: DMT family transporter [Planctomycetota bacterium]